MFRGHILGHQGKIGRIAKNQFLLIDSLTGEFCEIFKKLAKSTNEEAICLRTDLAEIALVGEIGSTVIAELTGLNEADIGYDDFLPCDLAAEVFLSLSELPRLPHFRLLVQSSDVNYVFQAIEEINQRLGGIKEGALSYQRYMVCCYLISIHSLVLQVCTALQSYYRLPGSLHWTTIPQFICSTE